MIKFDTPTNNRKVFKDNKKKILPHIFFSEWFTSLLQCYVLWLQHVNYDPALIPGRNAWYFENEIKFSYTQIYYVAKCN